MKKNSRKPTKTTPQLELFNKPLQKDPSREQEVPKVVSMSDFKHKQDVKKFYEVATELTSHLK